MIIVTDDSLDNLKFDPFEEVHVIPGSITWTKQNHVLTVIFTSKD